jgi:hypothetical protein
LGGCADVGEPVAQDSESMVVVWSTLIYIYNMI